MIFPNFLIIGPPKTGTTALYAYLQSHSEILLSKIKEPGYFLSLDEKQKLINLRNKNYTITDLQEYLDLFKTSEQILAAGEASTHYFYSKNAAARIKQVNPNMRIITILRNPVDRAYSEYLMYRLNNTERSKSFEKAIDIEMHLHDQSVDWNTTGNYLRRGFYLQYLKVFYQIFQKEKIKVFLQEEFQKNPQNTLNEIYNFLNVKIESSRKLLKYNKSGIPKSKFIHSLFFTPNPIKNNLKFIVPNPIRHYLRSRIRNLNLSKPPLSGETRERLLSIYKDEIYALQAFLGRDLTSWFDL